MRAGKVENRRGLVGHWKYHGNVSSLGIVYNISGNNNNGSLLNNTFVDNQGVNFDGIGDYVDCGSSTNFANLLTTISFNITPHTYSSGNPSLLSYNSPTGSVNGFFFHLALSPLRIVFVTKGNNASNSDEVITSLSGFNIVDSIIITIDSVSNIKMYKNGSLEDTAPSTFLAYSGSQNLFIGKNSDSFWDFFDGTIDNIQIYNRALLAEEIKQLYHTTRRF